MIEWSKKQPTDLSKTYLLKFNGGVIATGKYRKGSDWEPQPSLRQWRTDCCGKFDQPIAWAELS